MSKKTEKVISILLIIISLISLTTLILLFNQHTDLKDNHDKFSVEINEHNDSYKELESKVKDLKQELEDLSNEKDEKQKELQDNIDSLLEENENIIKENEEVSNDNKDLESQIALKQQQKEQAEKKANTEKVKTEINRKTTRYTGNHTGSKVAYLTFDDGPSANTIRILDTLDDYNIKATFFVNGSNSAFAKNTYKEIVNRGHSIGNHTYSHQYSYIYGSVEGFKNDFYRLQDLIKTTTGVTPDIARFPGGSNNSISRNYGGSAVMHGAAQFLIDNGYVYFDWNVSSGDANAVTVNKNKIVSNVLNGAKGKKSIIVLFHDSKPKTTTADALPEIIEGLHNQGFSFQPLTKDSFVVQFMRPL